MPPIRTDFEDFFIRTQEAVFAYLLRLSRDRDTAMDLVQQVYLRVIEYLNEHPDYEIRNEKSWLFRIAYTQFIDYKRKAGRATNFEPDKLEAIPAVRQDQDLDMYIKNIFDFLSAEKQVYGQMFLLKVEHNFSQKEIAGILGVNERSVRRYTRTIQKKLSGSHFDPANL